jgi:nitrogen-specific signal transduction histidine kinase
VAAIIAVAVRYRLLDTLPLARRDVIDAINDAVILTDGDGLILDLNPSATQLLDAGRPMRDVPLARALARLAGEDDMAGAQRNVEETLSAGGPATLALRTHDQRDLEIQIGSVSDAEGEPSARFAVVRDVTEARRYERLLRESQQRVVVGGLAAGLAHEVNNPLAFVASNLQQVQRTVTFLPEELESFEKRRAEELSELAEVVGETIDGVKRIAEIVGRIIRPGTLSEDDLVRLDLSRVIQDAVRLVEFHGESSVRTCIEPMEGLPQIDGCPERLSQALLNLLLNAQQAAGAVQEGSLYISAASDREGVALRLGVRDGRGEPYAGVLSAPPAASFTSQAELSAAYETVREHGGALESGTEPGVLFVLRLPAAA